MFPRVFTVLLAGGLLLGLTRLPQAAAPPRTIPDRSPVDLALTADEQWLLTANQSADSVSLVEIATGTVRAEVSVGRRPAALALTPDERQVLVSCPNSGELFFLSLERGKLTFTARLVLPGEPRGIVVSPDGKLAYAALTSLHAVAVIDVSARQVLTQIPVGRWPRYLALTPDGKRLAVGVSGDGGVAVIDTVTRKRLFLEDFVGLNLGQMQVSRDGLYVYFPWIVYGHNPITSSNIRRGWVLASRIARVKLDRHARREAIALDPEGRAVGDPHGIALSPDEKRLVCAASGTHELLVFRLPGLPFKDYGGPGDHIDPDLLKDRERFQRIELGGRPMAVRFRRDGRHVLVANYLKNSVQEVDLDAQKVTREIALGGPVEPSLARRGEAIFYDARRSFDQWYSCHSCHYEGGINAQAMDTRNDGRSGNFKTVLDLRGVEATGPWFWHGNEKDLDTALKRSMTDTMVGKAPSADDTRALRAFLRTLEHAPSPHPQDKAVRRGEQVFLGDRAGCSRCHPAPHFTDNKPHDVGTGQRGDAYRGFHPPSLRGVHQRVLLLHDGRSRSLEELLRGPHAPEKVTRRGALTEQELADLIAYIRSL